MPPRQERWPTATPAGGWPSYRDGEQEDPGYGATAGYRQQAGWPAAMATAVSPATANGYDWSGHGYAGTANGYPGTANGYPGTANGYPGTANGYLGTANGYAGTADDFDRGHDGYGRTGHGYSGGDVGYAETDDGYTGADDGYTGADDGYTGADDGYGWAGAAYTGDTDGYDWTGNGYGGPADGYAGGAYLGPGSYVEPGAVLEDDPPLTAPDAGADPDRWQAEQARRREAGRRGPMVGAVSEFLAIGVVVGVSTLAAALLKSATSPVSAMGAVFIARTPAALRNAVLNHFGTQGRTVLLAGMYVTFAVVAIVIGMMARRDAAVGVVGVAAFTLFAAFVAITRPAGQVADVAPAVIGGLAGVAAVLWLFRASAPPRDQGSVALRSGRGGTRRRTR